MKKRLIFWALGLIALIIFGYYAYNLISFNSIDHEEFSIETKIEDSFKNIGVFDNKLYYTDDNKLVAKSQDKGQIFEKHLGLGLVEVVYDKYIYVAMDKGLIKAFDRDNAKLVRTIDLTKRIHHIEIFDKYLFAYGDKEVFKIDLYLKDYETMTYENRPLVYRVKGEKEALIFLDRDLGGLKSRIKILEAGKEIFSISSVDEVFMHIDFLKDGSLVAMTNSYLYLLKDGKILRKTFIINPRAIDIKDDFIALVDYDSLKLYDKDLKINKEVNLGFLADRVGIYQKKILIAGSDLVASYENENLIKTSAKGMKGAYLNQYGMYVIFADRVEKVRSD